MQRLKTEIRSTAQLQDTRGFTFISGYELCSLLKTTVTVKCRTAIKGPLFYLNLCLSVIDSLFHLHLYHFLLIKCNYNTIMVPIRVSVLVYNAKFQQYFSYIVAVSFIGEGNRSTHRKPLTCRKSLTNFYHIKLHRVHFAMSRIPIHKFRGVAPIGPFSLINIKI